MVPPACAPVICRSIRHARCQQLARLPGRARSMAPHHHHGPRSGSGRRRSAASGPSLAWLAVVPLAIVVGMYLRHQEVGLAPCAS